MVEGHFYAGGCVFIGKPAIKGIGASNISMSLGGNIGINTCGHLNGLSKLCSPRTQDVSFPRSRPTKTTLTSSKAPI